MAKKGSKIAISLCLIILAMLCSVLYAQATGSGKYNYLVSWDPSTMLDYNCYAYVLDITNRSCVPGEFSNQSIRNWKDFRDVEKIAEIVVEDLQNLGKTNVYKTTTYSPPSSSYSVITLRTYRADFHFMKLGGSSWLHKPGPSAILRSKYGPQNEDSWKREYYNGKWNLNEEIKYNSTIYYIYYSSPGCIWDGRIWVCPMVSPFPIEQGLE